MVQEKQWQTIENVYFSPSNHCFHWFSSILMALPWMKTIFLWVAYEWLMILESWWILESRWKFTKFPFQLWKEITLWGMQGRRMVPKALGHISLTILFPESVALAGASVRRKSYILMLFFWQLIMPLLLSSLVSILSLSKTGARRVQWF